MEGRWTLILDGPDEPVGILTDPTEDAFAYSPSGGVPVVPCDLAAVERVAVKLAELYGYMPAGPLELDRRKARELLRAAAGVEA